MLDVGGATSVLVVTEYILSLLVVFVATFTVRLRARRLLYQHGHLDLSEIAWASRRTILPNLVYSGHPTAILNVVRTVAPWAVVIAFVFIGSSLENKFSTTSFELVKTKVSAQTTYWDTLGRKSFYVTPFVERAAEKGEWKGVPEKLREGDEPIAERFEGGGIPTDNTQFARMKWVEPRMYTCEEVNVSDGNGKNEYAISSFKFLVGLEPKGTTARVVRASRVRKVVANNESTAHPNWFLTPYKVAIKVLTETKKNSSEQVEERLSRAEENVGKWEHEASGGAFNLNFTEWNFRQDQYANVLDRTAKILKKHCRKITKSDIVVDYIGIPRGRRKLANSNTQEWIDITRGIGIRQQFKCRRRVQSKQSCDPPVVSTLSLVAGLVVGRGETSVHGTVDGEESYLAKGFTSTEVAKALEVGFYAILSGASATKRDGTINIAKAEASVNWTAYGVMVAIALLLCLLMLGAEFVARLRFGRLFINIEAPLDALDIARACGVLAVKHESQRRIPTPKVKLGVGARITKTRARASDSHLDMGVLQDGSVDHEETGEPVDAPESSTFSYENLLDTYTRV